MWAIAFFSLLLVAIFIYAILQKKRSRDFSDAGDLSDDDEGSNRS